MSKNTPRPLSLTVAQMYFIKYLTARELPILLHAIVTSPMDPKSKTKNLLDVAVGFHVTQSLFGPQPGDTERVLRQVPEGVLTQLKVLLDKLSSEQLNEKEKVAVRLHGEACIKAINKAIEAQPVAFFAGAKTLIGKA